MSLVQWRIGSLPPRARAAIALAMVACGAQENAPPSVVRMDPPTTPKESASSAPMPTPPVADGAVDVSRLTPRERSEWSTYMNELLAPCPDVAVPLSQCVSERRACDKCLPAARLLVKIVSQGATREMIEASYHNRFDLDHVRDVQTEGSPARGAADARAVVVEWADFECPHCEAMAPTLDKLASDHPSDVRLVYKFMPLEHHTHAEPAARAAIAAQMQGKFWEMHHAIFAHTSHLEQSDLEGYARAIGLDVARFRKDMASAAATERLAADRKQADALKVMGTPTIYINGRLWDGAQSLEDWVALDLSLARAAH